MDIPTVDLEEFEVPEIVDETAEDKSGGSLKFAFVGAGQCGSRLADSFYRLGYKKNIVVNTTDQDFTGISVEKKIVAGSKELTGGAGKNMEIAKKAVNESKEDIYNAMESTFGEPDHIFICAGLGGGTGGGGIEALIDLATRYMVYLGIDDPRSKIGAIVTLPTQGESASPIVAKNALRMGTILSDMASKHEISPLVIVDNDRVSKLYRGLTVKKFYPTINDSIAQLLHVFNRISTESSEYITFDSTDFRTILNSSGHMIMGVSNMTEFEPKTKIADTLKKNLGKTLLASDFDLNTANSVAVVVVGGENEFEEIPGLMESIEYGFDTIASLTGNARVHRGIYSDVNRNGKLGVYTLIGGLKRPIDRYKKIEARISE